MKKRRALLALTLAALTAVSGLAGCGKKEETVTLPTETVEVETETEEATLAVTMKNTEFTFVTGTEITVFDLVEDVASESGIAVDFAEIPELPAEEDVETTEMSEEAELVEATESVEDTESTELIEEEPQGFASYQMELADLPVLVYAVAGEYTNTLTITNADGETFEQEIKFIIADAPVITAEDADFATGDEDGFAEYLAGITAEDAADGDITASVKTDSENVDIMTAGTYTLTITAENSVGLTAEKIVTITVEDKKETAQKKTDSKDSTTKKKNDDSTKTGTDSENDANTGDTTADAGNDAGNDEGNTPDGGNGGDSGNNGGDAGNGGNQQPTTPPTTPPPAENPPAGDASQGIIDSNNELSNSGTVITGDDAKWAIDNGILDHGGILNPDGSVTMP